MRLRRALAAILLVGAALAGVGPATRPAAAAVPDSIDLIGHGWGHGRGMGQWGALGYARQGLNADQILQHFYGRTTPGNVASQQVPVRLENLDGVDLIVQSTAQLTTSATTATYQAARIRRTGAGWAVDSGPGCAGPWAPAGTSTGPVTLSPTTDTNADAATPDQMLQACQPNSTIRWYRGTLTSTTTSTGSRIAVNTVDLERYLVSVVGSEMSAAWSDIGGGAALQAQAVAARSYVLAENRALPAYRTSDSLLTSCCQAYSGAAVQAPGGSRQSREDSRVRDAVSATIGRVRIFGGAPARTEYSASSGGWTVASNHSDAVVDEGDDVSVPGVSGGTNPRHTWTASVPRSSIEAAFAPGGSGALLDIAVSARNGLGDLGGRVTQVHMQFSNGAVDVSGTTFKSKLYCNCSRGPISDWFAFTNLGSPSGGVGGYWIADSAGGVFSFGRAVFHGSAGGSRLNSPILGLAPTREAGGYWLVAGDGGIFSYGDARFYGSTGSIRLSQPIVGMAATPSAEGYWMVAADGGLFAYGNAPFAGSLPSRRTPGTAIGMAPTRTGNGYLIPLADGTVQAFGDAPFMGGIPSAAPSWRGRAVGLATVPA